MILDIVKLAVGAGTHIMSNRQKRKMLESDAALVHAEKMAKGEIEYQAAVRKSNDQGFKDEFVLILVSLPILVLIWSIFSVMTQTSKQSWICSLSNSRTFLIGIKDYFSGYAEVYTDFVE